MTAPTTTDLNEWADLYSLLSECFKRPDDQFVDAVEAGVLETELREHSATLDLSTDVELTPPPIGEQSLYRQYLGLFEGFETPHAPPVESPYRDWYGEFDGGLVGGPSAREMQARYGRLNTAVPDAYEADHVALLLEYAGLLCEAELVDELRSFVAGHFDWIPAFWTAVRVSTADALFYRWLVALLDDVVSDHRSRLGVDSPDDRNVQRMLARLPDKEHEPKL